jgi:hypothetical protein
MWEKKYKKPKEVKIQDSTSIMDFFGTLPCSTWAMLAAWLHIGSFQKIQKN